jgi:hypothetical protein
LLHSHSARFWLPPVSLAQAVGTATWQWMRPCLQRLAGVHLALYIRDPVFILGLFVSSICAIFTS